MSFGSFFSNMGSRISRGVENMAAERARRLNDPAFQAELLRSRNEFSGHITNMGSSALDGTYRLLLRTPIATTWFAVRGIFDDKVTGGHMLTKFFDELGAAGSSIGQTVLHAGRALGRGTWHTLRWLVAK